MDPKKLSLVIVLGALLTAAVFAETPDWAKDKKADYDQIAVMVNASLVKNGLSPVIDGADAGTLRFTMEGSTYVMNLYNIFATCAGSEKKSWPALVDEYVGKVKKAYAEEQEAAASLEAWTSAKNRLFLRVYPTGYVQNMREGYVGFEEIPGTISVVVVDLPSSVSVLDPQYLAKWKKEAGEVFLAAKANTLGSLKSQKVSSSDVGQGEKMSYYYDESNVYISTLALDRDLLKTYDGAYGLFLSVPSRSIVLIQPIKDVKYLYSLALNIAMNAADFYKKASGPVIPDICWFHQGKYYPITLDTAGTQNKMVFPDELKALLR